MPRLFCLFVVIVCSLSSVQADTIRIAVASNFAEPMKALAAEYQSLSGHQVLVSSASSGKLFAQIQQGAPFHLFFSADVDKPKALELSGHAVEGSRFTYAEGRLALWSRNAGVDAAALQKIATEKTMRVALANPALAPYGLAAEQVLEQAGLTHTRQQWVIGENVAQSLQFAYTGNVAFAFVSLSQAREMAGSYWLPPRDWHQPILQQAVLIRGAEDNAAATGFIAFVQSPEVRERFQGWGYEVLIP